MTESKRLRQEGRVDLKALAARLGLSQATVSRALSGHEAISAATRQRVAAAARELGYRPNPTARRLATGRVGAIGLVLPLVRLLRAQTNFFGVLAGISEMVTLRNYDLMLSPFMDDEDAAYKRLASSRSVDGVVITRPRIHDDRIALLDRLGLPFVLHGRTQTDIPHSFVDVDNEAVFAKPTRLLLNMGHRRIAALNASMKTTFASDRESGWRRAHEAAGIAADPALHLETAMGEEDGYLATQRLLKSDSPPTAILCGSTFLAVGVYRALKESGLEPGRDLSVVAHDDLLQEVSATRLFPALTTTESSVRAAGRRVAEILLDQIIGTADAGLVQEIWPAELVVRDSVSVVSPARAGKT